VDRELDRLRDALDSRGVKLTQQRIEIYLELLRSVSHPSVSDIYEAVRRRLPSISMDTVYRTLWLYSELGLANPVGAGGDRVRFDPDTRHHHHFVCARCGATVDFESPDLDRIPVPDEARRLGWVWGARMELRGLCNACRDAPAGRLQEGGEGISPGESDLGQEGDGRVRGS
jgi:Fur family peroxide stress response transcriptional regulator